jgi:hypothetical protein
VITARSARSFTSVHDDTVVHGISWHLQRDRSHALTMTLGSMEYTVFPCHPDRSATEGGISLWFTAVSARSFACAHNDSAFLWYFMALTARSFACAHDDSAFHGGPCFHGILTGGRDLTVVHCGVSEIVRLRSR